MGDGHIEKDETMQTYGDTSKLTVPLRCLQVPGHCPHCGDRVVAPEASEFVTGGLIRHRWLCESCGRESRTAIALVARESQVREE